MVFEVSAFLDSSCFGLSTVKEKYFWIPVSFVVQKLPTQFLAVTFIHKLY